jgi:hypothetical protein
VSDEDITRAETAIRAGEDRHDVFLASTNSPPRSTAQGSPSPCTSRRSRARRSAMSATPGSLRRRCARVDLQRKYHRSATAPPDQPASAGVPEMPWKPVEPVRRRCTHDRTPNSTTRATTYSASTRTLTRGPRGRNCALCRARGGSSDLAPEASAGRSAGWPEQTRSAAAWAQPRQAGRPIRRRRHLGPACETPPPATAGCSRWSYRWSAGSPGRGHRWSPPGGRPVSSRTSANGLVRLCLHLDRGVPLRHVLRRGERLHRRQTERGRPHPGRMRTSGRLRRWIVSHPPMPRIRGRSQG